MSSVTKNLILKKTAQTVAYFASFMVTYVAARKIMEMYSNPNYIEQDPRTL